MFFKKRKPKIKATEITGSNFNEIIQNTDLPVVIDFWAGWCGPCKVMGPIIDELAREYEGKAILGKVNTEVERKLAAHFQIQSIPTFLFIKNGKLYHKQSGMIPKPNLEEMIEKMAEME